MIPKHNKGSCWLTFEEEKGIKLERMYRIESEIYVVITLKIPFFKGNISSSFAIGIFMMS
jgi:hypothetical protein